MQRQGWVFILSLLVLQSLAGCTGVLETTVEPRAALTAYPLEIQEGEMVNFDARDSDAIEGIISDYSWDFGDKDSVNTVAGFTSHQFNEPGLYNVRLTVTNDQGGTDSTTVMIRVNGAPRLNLSLPEVIRAGDIALLDASATVDPEGAPLSFEWDLNHFEDSDSDGDTRNDIDSTDSIVYLETAYSGSITGSLTVSDGEGGVVQEQFILEVLTRMYKVVWVTQTLDWEYDEYLNQGDEWTVNLTPGDGARIISYEALLELDQDLVMPPDNFTLSVNVVDDGHHRSSQTTPGNITQNESTQAEINGTDLNPEGENDDYESDSAEQLIAGLLNEAGARFGQGEWVWTVVARDADPDALVDGLPDPDGGNDWLLTITIQIMVPVLTEVAYE
ncbi:MAG: PKD domain-containing protein [Candidatus Poseidoniaceae archaeon]|nr:PKD domain-containing protein [Candidatus Poseidoniaceae archaeon]